MESQLRWYLTSSALFVIPMGIGQLLLPWLLAIYLQESATRIGLAQMFAQLPVVLLVLWGGWLGDRVDQRRLLIYLTLLISLPPLMLAAIAFLGSISYWIVVFYSILMGCCMAFIQPARDALLNWVAGHKVQQVVTITIGLQWGVQIIGFAIGSTADFVGPSILLLVLSLFTLTAAYSTYKIPLLESTSPDSKGGAIDQILEGLVFVWEDRAVRTAIIQIFALAVFFAGAYIVLLPVMIRELYQGGSVALSSGFGANLAGTVMVTLALMKLGRVQYPGRVLSVATAFSCLVLLALTVSLPVWLFYPVVFLWGAGGGLIVIMSRSIVQESAPETHRARIMSIFSLAMMGGSPIGSVIMGLVIDEFGVHQAAFLPIVGMMLVGLFLALKTRLWSIKSNSLN